jgi:hypothetical protein
MKFIRRVGRAIARVVLHDKDVVKAERGLIALAVVRILIAAGAAPGVVLEAERILRLFGLS